MSTEIESVAIGGNTYPVKDQIKQLGGRWDPIFKVWMVPKDKADEARKIVDGAPVKNARTNERAPTKVCWECGRRFTYLDAKRNDGDWSESYCGC